MNNLLCLVLISNKQKGFALPLALLIGLILMATGITMIMRAQGDQSKVVAQQARADGLTSSEAGITRLQDLLNNVRVMATFDSHCSSGDCWQTVQMPTGNPTTDLQKILKEQQTSEACSNPNNSTAAAAAFAAKVSELRGLTGSNWIDVGNNRYYRLVGYDYQALTNRRPNTPAIGQGILTLEGRSRTTAESDLTNTTFSRDDGDNAASRNRIIVSIPVRPSLPTAFGRTTAPALWVSEGATEDRSQTRSITVNSPNYSNGSDFQGDVVMSDNTTTTGFVEDTRTLRPNLECHINTNNIRQPTTNAPTPPYKAQFLPVQFPNLPTIPTNIPSAQRGLEITRSTTFPRPGDTTTTRTINNGQNVPVYEYIVNNIDLNGNDEITITPGQRVIFYVQGNIDGRGNGGIVHNCGTVAGCKPTNLQIFAYNNRTVLGSADPQICLKGGETIQAFIFAPAYSIGKTGNGAFTGAVWGKNWGKIQNCGSNNGAIAVTQGAEWSELIQDLKPAPLASLPQIGSVATWCEESVNTSSSQCVPSLPVVPTPGS